MIYHLSFLLVEGRDAMHVIVIGENEENRDVLSFVLRNAGLSVARSANANLVTKSLTESPADLLVIAPETAQRAVSDVRELRAATQAPLLVLVENLPESEHCDLLDAGADLVFKTAVFFARPCALRAHLFASCWQYSRLCLVNRVG
jgi:DNA-binding response OmpR family regulator